MVVSIFTFCFFEMSGQMPIHLLKEETLHNICRIDYELDKWVSFHCKYATILQLHIVISITCTTENITV